MPPIDHRDGEGAPTLRTDDAALPGILPSRKKATPYTAKGTKAALESLRFQVLPHPSCSPGLAPSELHIFWFLQVFLLGKILENEEEVNST